MGPDKPLQPRFGGLQTDWLVRSFGMVLVLVGLGRLNGRGFSQFVQSYPTSMLVLVACGVLLVVAGCRIMLLVPCSIAGWWFVVQVAKGDLGRPLAMQAAEYPVFSIVPTGILALIAVVRATTDNEVTDRPQTHQRIDELIVLFFRWLALTTLFWVSFHKLNWDFLTPEGSCETVVKSMISDRWKGEILPWLASWTSPLGVILLEGVTSITLLLFARRLGIIAVAVTFTMISLVNAIVVTLVVIVPASAFLPASDIPIICAHWRRFLAVWLGFLIVVLPVSHAHYYGTRWLEHAIHHGLVLLIIVGAGGCQLYAWHHRATAGSWAERLRSVLGKCPTLLSAWRPGRIALLSIISLLMLNGATPYLGLKFEYSFAMLSNLRVDDARWNHVLVPKWVRLTKYDPFIHLDRFEAGMATTSPSGKQVQPLHPALYSPWVVAEQLQMLAKQEPPGYLDMAFRYQGSNYVFEGPADSADLRKFIKQLPPKHRLFQSELTLDGPQRCIH